MQSFAKRSVLLFACLAASAGSVAAPLVLVPELDLGRYLGLWYEIARFTHSFERGLVGVTAFYERGAEGKIAVRNSGYKGGLAGPLKVAKGRARLRDPGRPAALQVSFFGPFWADYLIIGLDPDYRWALVGDESRKYLWFLSREPAVDEATMKTMRDLALGQGFDLSRLELVVQGPE
jgi:apolipoprotein D and lipocalin family protein